MRKILFRAWIKEDKTMVYQSDNTASCMNGLELFAQKVGAAESTPEIMQFTGLHDKNGKEIYEFDVLESKYNDLRGQVVYGKGVISCDSGYVGGDYIGFFLADKDGKQIFENKESINWPSIDDDFEVIGNIYENEDLLK